MSHRFRRLPDVEAAPMQNEIILYQPSSNRFCLLNETAAFLWEWLKEPHAAEELAQALCEHFSDVEPSQAEADVRGTLDQFSELHFVEAVHEVRT